MLFNPPRCITSEHRPWTQPAEAAEARDRYFASESTIG